MGIQEILGLLVVVGIIVIVVAIVFGVQRVKTRCKSCKTKYDYDTDVEWSHIGSQEDNNGNVHSEVECRCVCHKCGKEKTFRRTFCTLKQESNGKTVEKDLENLVRNYFK